MKKALSVWSVMGCELVCFSDEYRNRVTYGHIKMLMTRF